MIRLLDKKTADKIAAGEVIDRPVSIVKELVENSLDAGASSITIEIREGGRSYIRITDDGCGIDGNEVETAFLRHATSKITSERDLETIGTLGFRGEALASICAVSRVEMITKRADAKAGKRLLVEGSKVIENSICGCPDGTTITVKDLFFNVPARYKFLNSDGAEARRIIDFTSRIALAYPDVRFRVFNGSKDVFATPGRGDIRTAILSVYGADTAKDLIPVDKSGSGFTLKGFVSGPGTSMPSRNRQIFCVNGRIVASGVMERALDRAYSERLFPGRFPVAFLFLAVPPEKLDVNIHPTKREIRFDDNGEVEDFLRDAVSAALMSQEAIPEIRSTCKPKTKAVSGEQVTFSSPQAETGQNSMKDGKFSYDANTSSAPECDSVDINNILSDLRARRSPEKMEPADAIPEEPPKPFDFDSLELVGTLFNTYIAAQSGDVFYLIDQHAAHERVFYEKLISGYNSREKTMQQMLIPLSLNVPAEVTASEDMWISKVNELGYSVEFFGNNTYLVREIPAFMEQHEAESFLKDLFVEFATKPDLTNRAVLEKIIRRACKSAVKAGDVLSEEESRELFRQLKCCENPFSCPHGRPTFIKMTKHEIERMFKRV
ncbi:MAG: DNA mismatch repair endonuclease MutL [Lentihominibacter sp.]